MYKSSRRSLPTLVCCEVGSVTNIGMEKCDGIILMCIVQMASIKVKKKLQPTGKV